MKRQAVLLPFDTDDRGNLIHTALPPEQHIPTAPDRDFWIGDAWGVTLTETPQQEADPLLDEPFEPGANTTPGEMFMSYQLHLYPPEWVDKILTAHAERGYTHFHLSPPRDRTDAASIQETVNLFKYVQSWGFFTSYWATGTPDAPRYKDKNWDGIKEIIEPFLRALIAAGEPEKTICLLGEELDSWNRPGPDGLDDIIAHAAPICRDADIPLWLHFTSNKPGWEGKAGQSIVDWWRWLATLGVRGCCWQSNAADSAALQSAHLWDTRKYLGEADSRLKVSAWELEGIRELYGQETEVQAARVAWEMICATRGSEAPNAPATAGSMNGPHWPDGRPFLMAA
jgi:hypothetical protein